MTWCGKPGCHNQATAILTAEGPRGYRATAACARHLDNRTAWCATVGGEVHTTRLRDPPNNDTDQTGQLKLFTDGAP